MKIFPAFRSTLSVVIALFLPLAAQAHPGHDGHELTWDLGHLASHPLATFLWTMIFSAGLWSLGKLAGTSLLAVRLAAARRKNQR